jgi:hypothetical protein
METDYVTEDGHYLSEEELIDLVRWQIEDFISRGYSESKILDFDDGKDWQYWCNNILRLYKLEALITK